MHQFINPKTGLWAVVSLGVLMATLDNSIVNIALPTIAHDLHASLPAIQWVVLGYMLGVICWLLPCGDLADRWNRQGVYTAGFALFTVASGFCALSQSAAMLIWMRGLQAVGGAAIMANGPGLVSMLSPNHRAKAFGWIGMIVSLGTIIGPSLGGWILVKAGWRWIFWVNLPIGVLGTWGAYWFLKRLTWGQSKTLHVAFDVRGMVLSAFFLLSLTLALTYGLEPSWHLEIRLALGAVTLMLLGVFLWSQMKIPHPLVPPQLFQNRLFTNCCLASLLSFIGITSLFFLMPFFWEVVQHRLPSQYSFMLMSCPLALAVSSLVGGLLSERWGTQRLRLGGMAVSALSLMGLACLPKDASGALATGWVLLMGVGNGLFHPSNNSDMFMSAGDEAHLGLVGSLQAIVRTAGMMLAVTIVGIWFQWAGTTPYQAQGFMPIFRQVFGFAAGLTLLNMVWIRVWR